MSANYLDETDYLAEAGQILRGETGKLATEQHLKALEQLVRTIRPCVKEFQRRELVPAGWNTFLTDWLRESNKCL